MKDLSEMAFFFQTFERASRLTRWIDPPRTVYLATQAGVNVILGGTVTRFRKQTGVV